MHVVQRRAHILNCAKTPGHLRVFTWTLFQLQRWRMQLNLHGGQIIERDNVPIVLYFTCISKIRIHILNKDKDTWSDAWSLRSNRLKCKFKYKYSPMYVAVNCFWLVWHTQCALCWLTRVLITGWTVTHKWFHFQCLPFNQKGRTFEKAPSRKGSPLQINPHFAIKSKKSVLGNGIVV